MSDINALQWTNNSMQQKRKRKGQKANQFSKRRRKDLEIKFDLEDLKEYVGGFSKRKEQRRKLAIQKQIMREQEERRDGRKEKIKQLKEQLNLPDDYGVGSLEDDKEATEWAVRDVKVFSGAVVTTTEVKLQSDSEEEETYQEKKSQQEMETSNISKKTSDMQQEEDKIMKKKVRRRLKLLQKTGKQKKSSKKRPRKGKR
eukprot:TRINITY_DN20020_c0_g2_i1.p2 TRINITY_DN20020_c0_g2~~TRINITY_DN20020_c0_g2_i1.p2  ORF type:complete len:200 (+),score=40.32 TRINITY_DN20020_c0_g2_i1:84-683(+)